ncbi:hypothetical protein [Bordetella pertussis]|uniref:hypothetical protein n=1 Tax=Bordetella pertussis TaxID=520 RepID=UPI00041D0E48
MNWGVGDFQFLKSGSDEPCIQPIESSHLAVVAGVFVVLSLYALRLLGSGYKLRN